MSFLHSGKTTDTLLSEAKELSNIPDKRELDMLLSTGEQMSSSKLAILLNEMGYNAISLTGWQTGIYTNSEYQNAKISKINLNRITKELEENKIVIITGFQGIDENNNITTLGRGGSDTTAVAIASVLNAKHCYIFSDVDGVYSADPKRIRKTRKLKNISYDEMLEISNAGAKVLHNRCVEMGKRYSIPIITESTFNNEKGTVISNNLEDTVIKSIIKNENILFVNLHSNIYTNNDFLNIYKKLISNMDIERLSINSNYFLSINFYIKKEDLKILEQLLENDFKDFNMYYINLTKIVIVGYGINNNKESIFKILEILKQNDLSILDINVNELKLEILLKEDFNNEILNKLHEKIIKQ